MLFPTFSEEKVLWDQGYDLVIGVDEVGRGSFAGPIVASAVAFPCHPERSEGSLANARSRIREGFFANAQNDNRRLHSQNDITVRIDDSKRLKPNERKKAADWIKKHCLAYSIGEVPVVTINKVGIGKATELAMRRAVYSILYKVLCIKKDNTNNILNTKYLILDTKSFLLVDAFYIKYLHGIGLKHQKTIIKGDQKSISIAAASIIAKVHRDSLMRRLDKHYAVYGWARNKGYGTKDHQEAILKNGLTKLHRTAFVATFLSRSQYHTPGM